FIGLAIVVLSQSVWWIVFMARLVDEKVELAQLFGADEDYIEKLHQQEIIRQIMIGSEGVFFLILVLAGAWLIYRALKRTEELGYQQQNFLLAVTHELKTPIASIMIYINSLASTKISEDKKVQIIPRMKADLNRLEKLVENILEAGRFERGQFKLNDDNFDLVALINDRIANIKKAHDTQNVQINFEYKKPVILVGDQQALRGAIEAVIDNAIKYNNKNPVVDIALNDEGEKINLVITDNGVGLDKQEQNKIFERFYRVGSEMNRQKAGSGLGLYLCREIIKAHGGEIDVYSAGYGKGSRFTIKLRKNL
ncbi:MAG: HAMP domain-containing sensor histidine kinase, partial [bacterium]